MSVASNNTEASTLSPIPCGEILYRLLTKASWLPQDGGVAAAAFYRRSDEDGISVFIASACPLEEARTLLARVKGIATLHTGRIRDLGLDVVPDPEDRRHAEIVGVPLSDEDLDGANYFADLLAEQARIA